jgi:hypothetical protein
MSYEDLQRELRRRQRSVGKLQRKRSALVSRLAQLDDQIRSMGGSTNGFAVRGSRGGGRPRNDMTLTQALQKVLSGKTLRVTDAADAVQRAGYRTSSSNFRTQVNIALTKGPFKRVGRGEYTAK